MTEGEINPELPIDDLALRDEWLRRDKWLRTEGPKHGIDLQRFFLGETLSDIVRDDGNFFVWGKEDLYLADTESFRRNTNVMRGEYEARLAREIITPRLPSGIKVALESMQEIVRSADWTDRKQFLDVRDKWNLLRGQVREVLRKNPELNESFEYYLQTKGKVDELCLASSGQSKE